MKNFSLFPLLIMGVFLVVASSCKKDENVPVLSTLAVTGITTTTATSGGNITDDGGATVTVRGVCWSTSENPTIDDSKTEDGTGAGSFTSNITDLELNTTYYLRAYATNSAGTGYGSAISFRTQDIFNDPRDGKVYQTVVIGNQVWMAKNLAYAPSSGNYWAYDNDDANVETYGYLYDWETAMDVCPTGWHLPSDEEWTELIEYLGGAENAGGKLKATGTIEAGTGLWFADNNGATNETGFTALPGGNRYSTGTFDFLNKYGRWWSATENNTNYARFRRMSSYNSNVDKAGSIKEGGLSVRCIKD